MLRSTPGVVAASVLLLVLVVVTSTTCADDVAQPIAFNHSIHITEAGLACGDCHEYARVARFAGLPSSEKCMECHEDAMGDSSEEKKVRSYAAKGEQIPWQRVYRLPADVFYSHRRHVVAAAIECTTCHGDIAALSAPPSRPLVAQTMDWCLDCHKRLAATIDCLHCHR